MPSTLRTELNRLGFDWQKGTLVIQDGSEFRGFKPPRGIAATAPELDVRFVNSGKSADLPRFIAQDASGTYVVFRDEADAGVRKILLNVIGYTDTGAPDIPYPK